MIFRIQSRPSIRIRAIWGHGLHCKTQIDWKRAVGQTAHRDFEIMVKCAFRNFPVLGFDAMLVKTDFY